MSTILLVRHGQNDWVNKRRLAGWTPGVHLNKQGKKQVKRLSKRLAKLPITAVYSSPLERCMETAEIVTKPHGLEIIQEEKFGEVRYGKWEGKKIKKVAAKREAWYAVQHFPSRFRFPKGESLREVQSRAVRGIEKIAGKHQDEMIVVVSHADVIKLILAHYLGIHVDLFQRIGLSPASVSALALMKSGPVRVLRVNDDGPLKAPPKRDKKKKAKLKKKEPRETPAAEEADAKPETEGPEIIVKDIDSDFGHTIGSPSVGVHVAEKFERESQ